MIDDLLQTSDAVRLVLGVARLGENDLRGWWRGHALDRTGSYVLSGMFRRTWRPAALELDIAAATVMHDELLGRSTAVHLFSDVLPFRRWALGWLAEQKTTAQPDALLGILEGWTPESAAEAMDDWCQSSESPGGELLGDGLLLGRLTATELYEISVLRQVLRKLGAAYLDQGAQLRPPYFDVARRAC